MCAFVFVCSKGINNYSCELNPAQLDKQVLQLSLSLCDSCHQYYRACHECLLKKTKVLAINFIVRIILINVHKYKSVIMVSVV